MNYNEDNLFFLTDFDDNMERDIVLALTREIQKQREFKNGHIDLYINSYGGYAHLAYQLISLIEIAKRDGVVVRTIVPAVAYSAGSVVAITGTPGERYIERTAEHLLHYGTRGSIETTPEQLERNFVQKHEGFNKIRNHYKKYANVPDLESAMNDDSFFVPAAKCIKWGLADKYMEKFDIGSAL